MGRGKRKCYLGERPPWEQFVGEVRGLVLLVGCRGGVRPIVLLGELFEGDKDEIITLIISGYS